MVHNPDITEIIHLRIYWHIEIFKANHIIQSVYGIFIPIKDFSAN